MRVAALYDVHANLHALEAVLADVERAGVDVVLFGGDLVMGPLPAATLARARTIDGARFVLGNADVREPDYEASMWTFDQLDDDARAFVGTFEDGIVLDGVLYRHGSPRSVDEIVTYLTPDSVVREGFDSVAERVCLIGHTHSQFDRVVDGRRLVNAGSVSLAYEGSRGGAYWALVDGGEVELRRTAYDAEAAAAAVPDDYPGAEQWAGWLREPPSAEEASTFFEQQVGRLPPSD
jgi:predicted phosphodiesterase